jgi:hypothetical protein
LILSISTARSPSDSDGRLTRRAIVAAASMRACSSSEICVESITVTLFQVAVQPETANADDEAGKLCRLL